MRFTELRNILMTLGWDRRVATLAARLILGVDTWEGIAACRTFLGNPLLSLGEATIIRDEIARNK
ncbi:MAG: hypothetical protein AMS22_06340 [Thiotrichales bacterium SG8_50]|nr:MAG: hypothetical protein AMS22_06340 [Thiotrichales bacterium SG8_50]